SFHPTLPSLFQDLVHSPRSPLRTRQRRPSPTLLNNSCYSFGKAAAPRGALRTIQSSLHSSRRRSCNRPGPPSLVSHCLPGPPSNVAYDIPPTTSATSEATPPSQCYLSRPLALSTVRVRDYDVDSRALDVLRNCGDVQVAAPTRYRLPALRYAHSPSTPCLRTHKARRTSSTTRAASTSASLVAHTLSVTSSR
ncbi:hypothetical protein B0H13DRAFT_2667138, partial [Mycena leptocephala]